MKKLSVNNERRNPLHNPNTQITVFELVFENRITVSTKACDSLSLSLLLSLMQMYFYVCFLRI